VEYQPTDQLHIIGTLADGALGGLPHRGKGFRQEFIQHFLLDSAAFLIIIKLNALQLLRQPLAELVRFVTQASSLRASNSGSRSLIWSTI